MPRKLKVFRTPIGFHDAYVAAPSRKAALAAWGTEANLFARGTAEEVTDERLMAEPLKRPGEVIRVSRGDLQAQLKALGPRKKAAGKRPEGRGGKPAADKTAKVTPPPRRDKVDKAEAALDQARVKQAQERAALEKQRDSIEAKLKALATRQARDIARLEARLTGAQEAYREALDTWSG